MKIVIAFILIVFGFLLIAELSFAQGFKVNTLRVPFETDIDLEKGKICNEPMGCYGQEYDIRFAFNADRINPTVLFQQYPAKIALLRGAPFDAVNPVVLNGLVFTEDLIDVPFSPNSTAIILTEAGNYFKVGYAICFTNNKDLYPACAEINDGDEYSGVNFWYQRLK